MIKKTIITCFLVFAISSISFAAPNLGTYNLDGLKMQPSSSFSENSILSNYSLGIMHNSMAGNDHPVVSLPLNTDNPPPGVPEPTTMILFGLGIAGAAAAKRFRKVK